MKLNFDKISERAREIALQLVEVKSVVETTDEVNVSDKVYEIMSQMKYYKEKPEHLYELKVKDDPWGRKVIVGIMEGQAAQAGAEKSVAKEATAQAGEQAGEQAGAAGVGAAAPAPEAVPAARGQQGKKTVVFIGHTDTVGISDYGSLAEFATKPQELMEKLKEVTTLTDEVREDLESGKYLFGRGIFDMKSGDAVVMAIMEEIGNNIEEFEGNIIFGAVCDEEGNSKGMLTLVPELVRLKKEKGYDYMAMLDPDYIAPAYPEDPHVYQYVGTVGKLMPTFLVVGKETHVGESFSGLDPNQIAAEITARVNLNPEFSDVVDGEVTLPPITLKQRDLKPEYSVQIASKAVLFFNYATHCSTPLEVLNKMCQAGAESFQKVIDNLNLRYEKFCQMSGREYKKLPWTERTMTYQQLYAEVRKQVGPELDVMTARFAQEVKDDGRFDVRDQALKVVEYVHGLWADKNPVLIVFLTPPYYPHIYVEGKNRREQILIQAVEKAVETTECEYQLMQKKFLPCISDLSYAAAPKEEEVILALKNNMPGFGVVYDLPLKDMQELDLPVADVGSYGKDAHQFTERVETVYTYEVLPEILWKITHGLLNM